MSGRAAGRQQRRRFALAGADIVDSGANGTVASPRPTVKPSRAVPAAPESVLDARMPPLSIHWRSPRHVRLLPTAAIGVAGGS